MDISSAHYKGRSLAWRSATTDTHPAFFDHEGEGGRGWLRSFYGGLVVTCGLTYAGANGEDQGREYGLHGRIGNLPATNVAWDGQWHGDDYVLTVSGKVREATVFGENLQLTRTITAKLGERRFFLSDVVENMGAKRTEHMMLYHINIGFPAVNDSARLIAPTLTATPRDADAEDGKERYADMQPPQAGFREKVYFHEFALNANGQATAAIVDDTTEAGSAEGPGFGVYCAYRPEQLPRFIEWKMMDAGTYVCGHGASQLFRSWAAHREREAGTLQFLEPGEKRQYDLELGVLCGQNEIQQLEGACREAVAAANLKQENATF